MRESSHLALLVECLPQMHEILGLDPRASYTECGGAGLSS